MNAMPHLVEVSLLLLLMFLVGSAIGYTVRTRMPQRASSRNAPDAQAHSAPVETVPERQAMSHGDAKDNLRKIKGIGQKIEMGLNGIGVYRFEQIAAWNAEEIARVDGQLSFHGRIEREDWVGQAKALMASAKED